MSLERCPGCRVRLTLGSTCPRCGCDLTLVRRAETQAGQLMVRAVQALARGHDDEASTLVQAALELENSAFARAVSQSLRV